MLTRFTSWLTEPISARPLGLTRIIVGAAATIRAFVAWRVLSRLTDENVINAPYAEWLPEPTGTVVVLIVAVWLVAAVLFTLGWRVAVSGPTLLVAIVLTLSLDQQAYSNHLYLMAWFVLLLTVAGSGASLSISKPISSAGRAMVVRWPVLLIMLQLSIVYFFAAFTKLNSEFLTGRVLAGVLHGGLVPFPDFLRTRPVLTLVAIGAVFVELFVGFFIWRQRFRPAAFVLGLGLHAMITLFMASTLELAVFSMEMLAVYPLFLSAGALTIVWDDDCGSCRDWIVRFRRLDLLSVLEPVGKTERGHHLDAVAVERSMHLVHTGETTSGFRAVTGVLEHLVPSLWVAPVLRLPGVSALGERWYRWQARRRTCAVGERPHSLVQSEDAPTTNR